MTPRVFVDANVLVSKTLMDWLFQLRLDLRSMFQTHATEDVLAEVLIAIRRRHPQAPGHLTHRRAQLIRGDLDEVVPNYDGNARFTGRDRDDYHVHAGAVAAGAHIVLTCNDPTDITTTPDDEPYVVMHPDDFFILVADSAPASLAAVTRAQVDYWGRKEGSRQVDDALRRAGCPQFAERVRTLLCRLAFE